MLVGSPSTASAHKLQSRVSIDLTGDEAAAAPVALPSATDDEHLLISRVQQTAAVGAPMMMGAIQTFYETLLKERPADVCNSIVFLCLEASDAGRLLPVADAATLRCLQWLASGLPPVDRGVTVDAVRQNLRDGCGVAATEAQVAGWLSR